MYERRHAPIASKSVFRRRVAGHVGVVVLGLVISLGIGMAGYMVFEALDWRDAFLNAAMLLGGEGPVEAPRTHGGKLFAGAYALYSGLILIAAAGIVLAPWMHRLLHKFHWERDGDPRR